MRNLTTCVVAFSLALLASPKGCTAQTIPPAEALAHARTTYSQQGARAALPEYENVLEAFRKNGDKHGEAVVTGLIGNCYKKLGDYPKALQLLNQALQMKRDLHDRLEEGKTLSHLGLVYWEQGDYPKAIGVFNQSIAIGGELKDAQLEGAALNNLSLVYEEQGDYRKSLQQYQRALELQRSVNYEPGVGDALGNIGGHYLLLGQYSTAEGYYRQAFEISEGLKLKPSQSLDLGNLAACLLGQGRIQESLATYDQAIAIAREAGQAKEEADWYRGKASALLHAGKFDEALRNYQSAGETYARAGLKRELVENLGDTGNAYLELGDHRGAEKNFLKAVSISQSIGHDRGIIINRLAVAEVTRLSGDPSQARESAERALIEARKVQDTAETVSGLLLLSRILLDLRQPRAALNQAIEAREIAQRHKLRLAETEALDISGKIELELGQAEAALRDLQEAQGIVAQSEDAGMLWSIEYHRGQALESLSRNDEALLAYRTAVASIESVRNQIGEQQLRTGYLQDKQQVYVALVQLLLKMRRLAVAFGYSEQLREYSYQDLKNRSFTIKSEANTEARSRLVQLQRLVSEESNRSDTQKRDQALQFFSEELLQAQKNYQLTLDTAGGDRTAEAFDATKVSSALASRAALLEYVVARDRLAIFVVTQSGLQALTEPMSEHNLRSKVELFRELLTNGDQTGWRKPAASLYSTLILPLEQRGFLKGIRSLIIVPHGVLNYLPFAALPRSAETSSRLLIENYEIQEEPAASFLTFGTGRNRSVERVAAFAPSSARLKYAMPEARDVAGIFGSRGEAILGRNATKSKFRQTAPDYDIVHVATHGFFNKNNPVLSGLQFEADGTDDGKLEVHDILAMRLSARLITLSACETALGAGSYDEIPAGDEFVGLNRAFLEAGSDAVIASLWKVDDRSTDLMMRSFYRRIESTRASSALAQAQREMIRSQRFASPYYWAPFIFFGRELAPEDISTENN